MSSKNKDKQVEKYLKGAEHEKRRSELKKANKKMRRNQSAKQARRKDWLPASVDVLDDADAWDEIEVSERIMPRDESERRRAVENLAFRSNAVTAEIQDTAQVADPDTAVGLVIETSKGLFRVQVNGRAILCSLRGNLAVAETGYTNAAAVGDQVVVREDGTGSGVIEAVLPRRSLLARPDVFDSPLQQIIVANVDQLLVVSAWREPHIWLELVDRYLIVAERYNLPAIICVNKIDLLEDAAELDVTMRPYRELGYPIVITSASTGAGIEHLRGLLANQTTVLAIGYANRQHPHQWDFVDQNLAYELVFGGHGLNDTGLQATWLPLNAGGAVVDTPGIREFGLSGLYQTDLVDFMPDLVEHAPNCRFNNCLHRDEPGCAVRAAAAAGHIATSRYESSRCLRHSRHERHTFDGHLRSQNP